MSAAEVHVFVDVDGVLNACHITTPPGWAWPDEEVVKVAGFDIRYSPALINRINTLAALPNVRMHWLTTWEHDARTELSPQIGLDGGEWPVIGTEEHYSKELSGGWWKFQALRDLLAESKAERVVWIDDDITYDREARDWLEQNGHILWVSPNTSHGITPKQMDRIEEYAGAAS